MNWRTLSVAVMLSGLLLTAPAQAQTKAALEVIPDDAIGFVLLNGLETVNSKIQAIAQKAQTPLPLSPLGFVKTLTGIEKGLDEQGSVALVLFDDDEEPIPVLCVPVTNYNDALSGLGVKEPKELNEVEVLGKNLLVGKRGNYALVAEVKNKATLQKALNASKSVTITKQLASYIADNDLVAVVTTTGIKQLSSKAKEGLGEAKNKLETNPPFVADYIEWMTDFVKSAETEIPNAAFGLKIDGKQNIFASMRADFKEGGSFAKAGKQIAPLKDGALAGLPDGPTAFVAGGIYPESFLKSMMQMNTQLLKSLEQLDKKDLETIEKAYTQAAKGMRGMSMSMSAGKPGQALLEGVAAVAKVDDADEYIANYVKAIEVTGEIYKKAGDNIPFGSMAVKSIKIGDAPAAEVEMDLSKAPQIDENTKKILERIMGEGGKLHVTMVAADKNTVIIRYVGAKETARALEDYRKNAAGLANNADIAKTAALLPARSQWVAYFGPKAIVDLVRRAVDDFAPGAVQIPQFPETPPIGIGAEISGGGFDVQLVVPASVTEGLGRLIQQVKRQQGGGAF